VDGLLHSDNIPYAGKCSHRDEKKGTKV